MTEEAFIRMALEEDLRAGDHTSRACLSGIGRVKAKLVAKEDAVISGMKVAEKVFKTVDPDIVFIGNMEDGTFAEKGSVPFEVSGNAASLLMAERLALNFIQRMSGVATLTRELCDLIRDHNCTLLDTRKTTPGFRHFEKQAVVHGGGMNHRFGLFDMILIKDNHIDYCGGVDLAILKAHQYLHEKSMNLPIVVEVRNQEEIEKSLSAGGISRLLLDNFSPEQMSEAVKSINGKIPTEASGGINRSNIRAYAATGVNFISLGALTHSYRSMDLSLKAD